MRNQSVNLGSAFYSTLEKVDMHRARWGIWPPPAPAWIQRFAWRSERLLYEYGSGRLADVLAGDGVPGVLGVGVAVLGADVVAVDEPGDTELPVGVVQGVAVADAAVASLVFLAAHVGIE